MTSTRAMLLVLLLASLSVAAPAPLPRTKRQAASHPWGEAVDGLRMRLLPEAARRRVGEPFRISLEIQNVSGASLAVVMPRLCTSVSRPGERLWGWEVTAERIDERSRRPRKREDSMDRALGVGELGPGETLRYEITLLTRETEDKLEELQKEGEDIKVQMYFPDADVPGTYEFRATFRRHPRREDKLQKGGWSGKSLSSPPIRIELVK